MSLADSRRYPSLLNSLLSEKSSRSIDDSISNTSSDQPWRTTHEQFSSLLATIRRLTANPPANPPLMSFHRAPLLSDREDVDMIDALYVKRGLVKPFSEFLKKAEEQMETILKSRPTIKPLVKKKNRFNQSRPRPSGIPSKESSSVATFHAFVPIENDVAMVYQSHAIVGTTDQSQCVKPMGASFQRNRQVLNCQEPSTLSPVRDNSESTLIVPQENPSSPQAAAQAPPGPPALPKNEAESKSSASKASEMAMSPPLVKHNLSPLSVSSELKKRKRDKNARIKRSICMQTAKKSTTQSMQRPQQLTPCKVVVVDVANFIEDVTQGYPYVTANDMTNGAESQKKNKSKSHKCDKDVARNNGEVPCKKVRKSSSPDGIVPKIRIFLKPNSCLDNAKVVDKENTEASKNEFASSLSSAGLVEIKSTNCEIETHRMTPNRFSKELNPNDKSDCAPIACESLGSIMSQSPANIGSVIPQNADVSTNANKEDSSTEPILQACPLSTPLAKPKSPSPPLSSILNDNNANSTSSTKDPPKTVTAPIKKYIKLADYRKRTFLKSLAKNNNNSISSAGKEGTVTCLPIDQTPCVELNVTSLKLTKLEIKSRSNTQRRTLDMECPAWQDLMCIPCDLKFRSSLDWSQHKLSKH